MLPGILQRICDLLPYYGEDEATFCLSEKSLHDDLLQRFPSADPEIKTTIAYCRMLLSLSGVLDSHHLKRGEWRFISYPARTAAVSTLRLLLRTTRENDFSIIPREFWTDPGKNTTYLRQLLEILSKSLSSDKNEPAVRISYVSFALLRCGDYFLCHNRELDDHDPDRNKGDLVLPGGRLTISDLPQDLSQETKLRLLSSPEGLGEYAAQAHERALHRELAEELELTPDMYESEELSHFKPYRGCHGGGNRHAWTDTIIRLYKIKIRPEYAARLQKYFDMQHARYWASAKELWESRNALGAKIFFDACRENLASEEELSAAWESFPFLQKTFSPQKYMSLSGDTTLSVTTGRCQNTHKSGRPPISPTVSLSEEQSQLLLALGMAQRSLVPPRGRHLEEHGLSLRQDRPRQCEVALGGLLLHSQDLRAIYSSLPGNIRSLCSSYQRYYILCVRLYFPPSFFSYSIEQSSLYIHRKEITLPLLGLSCPAVSLKCKLTAAVLDIFCGKQREGIQNTLRMAQDKLSNQKLSDRVKDIGLFKLFDNDVIIIGQRT